ncbi:MAG: DUF4837 family protein [Cyclobacteriaceae bacterium]
MRSFFSKVTFLLLITTCLISCTEIDNKLPLIPDSIGKDGGILIVAHENTWESQHISLLKKALSKSLSGLPKQESLFKISTAPPRIYFKSLNQFRTVIIPVIIHSRTNYYASFTENLKADLLAKIEKEKVSLLRQDDKYAKDQYIVYLFATTENELNKYLSENQKLLSKYVSDLEIKHLAKELATKKKNISAMKVIKEKFGLSLSIPAAYKIARDTTDFIWLRNSTQKEDFNIFMSKKKYSSPDQFQAKNILKWRKELGEKYISGKDKRQSFMETENYISPAFQEESIASAYAKKCRGMWKLHNLSMGGTFLSYVFANTASNELFYLEAFLHNPTKSKTNTLRELETILKSATFTEN